MLFCFVLPSAKSESAVTAYEYTSPRRTRVSDPHKGSVVHNHVLLRKMRAVSDPHREGVVS